MREINIVYGDNFSDADIILVPDIVAENLEKIGQDFLDWAVETGSDCWRIVDGREVCCVETEDFIRWIDKKYFERENCNATIIAKFTKYNPKFPTVEF